MTILLIMTSVIVASGLIALVDDCIKSRWHKAHFQLNVPGLKRSSSAATEHIGPKRLMEEVFHRRRNREDTQ